MPFMQVFSGRPGVHGMQYRVAFHMKAMNNYISQFPHKLIEITS